MRTKLTLLTVLPALFVAALPSAFADGAPRLSTTSVVLKAPGFAIPQNGGTFGFTGSILNPFGETLYITDSTLALPNQPGLAVISDFLPNKTTDPGIGNPFSDPPDPRDMPLILAPNESYGGKTALVTQPDAEDIDETENLDHVLFTVGMPQGGQPPFTTRVSLYGGTSAQSHDLIGCFDVGYTGGDPTEVDCLSTSDVPEPGSAALLVGMLFSGSLFLARRRK